MKKYLIIVIVIITLLLITACPEPAVGVPESAATAAEAMEQSSFSAGADVEKDSLDSNFTQTATGMEGTGATTYISSDEAVATVNPSTGEVDILGIGITTITASNAGDDKYKPATDSYMLTVTDTRFILTLQTTVADDPIRLYMHTGYMYTVDYTIDWGDGSVDYNQTDPANHTYAEPGLYTVMISGDCAGFYMGYGSSDEEKLLTIESWGDIEWQSMEWAFDGCSNLVVKALDIPNLSGVTDASQMFRDVKSIESDLTAWDVSNIDDMGYMFSGTDFNQDISGWNVSNVTDMNSMFDDTPFDKDIGSWNVSNVQDMERMFRETPFNKDIGSWNVSNVTDMSGMFREARAFNQDIGGWNVSNVEDMGGMFNNARAFNQDIGGWNVANVTNMASMFYYALNFNQDIGNWNVAKVSNMAAMFRDAQHFDQNIGGWTVSGVTNMSRMFHHAIEFNQDLSSWNVSNVENMSFLFYQSSDFTSDLSGWTVSNVTDMSSMFAYAADFNSDLSGWSVDLVEDMGWMFTYASSFSNNDLSDWNVSNVTDHEYFSDSWGSGNTEPSWP